MTYYYNLPKRKNVIDKSQIVRIEEQNQLKFICQEKSFVNKLLLDMKNTKVNDQSTICLNFIESELKLETIDASENFSFITDTTIENFCSCKGLVNIKSINLADNDITDLGIQMMCSHSNFKNLKTLILYGNTNLTFVCCLSLAKSEWIHEIQKIDLHATSIEDKGLVQFLLSQNSRCLQQLNVSMNWNRITDLSFQALNKSAYARNIKILNFQDCYITDSGVQLLCLSDNFQNLQSLNLSNSIQKSRNIITDKSLQYLSYSKIIISLKNLILKSTNVSSSGVKYLTSSHIIHKLQLLKLSQCKRIDNNTLNHIATIVDKTNLVKLHVNATSITRDCAAQFEEKYQKIMIIY